MLQQKFEEPGEDDAGTIQRIFAHTIKPIVIKFKPHPFPRQLGLQNRSGG